MQFQQISLQQLVEATGLGLVSVAVPGASVSVYESDGLTRAPIYNASGTSISNPMTADSNGVVGFAAANGVYYLIYVAGTYTSPQYPISFLDPASVAGITLTNVTRANLMAATGIFDSRAAVKAATISSTISQITTRAYATAGDGGGADYKRVTSLASGATGVTAADASIWQLCSPLCYPEMFGALHNGTQPASTLYGTLAACQADFPFASNLYQEIDWLALQAAFNHGAATSSPLGVTYYLYNSNALSQVAPLTAVEGVSLFTGKSCLFNASALTVQSTSTQYVTNPGLTNSAYWTNETTYTYINNAVFGSTGAVITDTDPSSSFSQFHQEIISLAPGKYAATAVFGVSLGHSYSTGNINPPYAGIGFFTSPGGIGQILSSASMPSMTTEVIANPTTTFAQTLTCYFELTATTTFYLTWTSGGYGNFDITSLGIQPWVPNCAILMTRDGQAEHYPTPTPFGGFEIDGPGSATTGIRGLVYKSFISQDGTLLRLQDTTVNGFGDGIAFEDGAYLTEFDNVNVISCNRGAVFEGGTANSGENFRWKGGGIFNCNVGIDNPGNGEFTLFGTPVDYNDQAITNNAGSIDRMGAHWEMLVPTAANMPLFHCIGNGSISTHGGQTLLAGGVNTSPSAIIQLDGYNTQFVEYGARMYNLTANNAAGIYPVAGTGVYRVFGWRNSGNPNIGPNLITQHTDQDIYGGMGFFPTITGTPWGETSADDIHIPGGCYPRDTSGSLLPMNDKWNATGGAMTVSLVTTHTPPFSSNAQTYSSNYPSQGTGRALLVQREYGLGASNKIVFEIPIQREGQDFLYQMYWQADAVSGGGSGTTPIYARLFWGRITGVDSVGRSVWSTQNLFIGEEDIAVPVAGSGGAWAPVWAARSTYGSHGAPSWCNSAALVLDMQSNDLQNLYFACLQTNWIG